MKIKSKCLVCQGTGSKEINGMHHACLGCKGDKFVYVNTVPKQTQEDIKINITKRTRPEAIAMREKITKAIMLHQQKYFETNQWIDLRPMILRDIAEPLGVCLATIYIHLPHIRINNIPAESFFTRQFNGANIHVIVEKIKKLMPNSDSKISELLKEQGITMARRTVTKYRNKFLSA